jgi:hypothetical protein
MLMAAICERMGWDFHTYQQQPKWFIDLLIGKYELDAKREREDQDRVK